MISRIGTVAAIVLIFGSASPFAQAQGRFQFGEYSAKFVCGVAEEKEPGARRALIAIEESASLPTEMLLYEQQSQVGLTRFSVINVQVNAISPRRQS